MPLIEVGAGASSGKIVGIDNQRISRRGRVVDRVAVGIGEAKLKSSQRVPAGDFQRVIDRRCSFLDASNGANTGKLGTKQIGIRTAGNLQINRRLSCDRNS